MAENAFAEPQTVLVLGGTSEIAEAVTTALVERGARKVLLACRDVEAGEAVAKRLRADGAEVHVTGFDVRDTEGHAALVEEAVTVLGDIDLALLAAGVLGDQQAAEEDPTEAVAVALTNYVGPMSLALHVAQRLRLQGHGTLTVLSSVAAERARRANFVYGSSKAGLDALAQGLGDALHGTGARVLVVRPGFVHTRMTAGVEPAPFATDPATVADVVLDGLRRGAHTVWAPKAVRPLSAVLRHLPRPVLRRLPR